MRDRAWLESLPIEATAWHGGLEWVVDQMLRVVVSASADLPKAKPQVKGGELKHFQIGSLSMEEKAIRDPSLSI